MSNALQTFQDILSAKGLTPPEILADGKLHRCPTEAKPHKQNGAYIATWIPRPRSGGVIGKTGSRARLPRLGRTSFPRQNERCCGGGTAP